jgi:gluconokinase
MGVSGAGKSTVMQALAGALAWPTAEADEFHPTANVERMRSGVPLTDDDRSPWLQAIADWIGAQEVEGRSSIVTCSALRRVYRDRLRHGHPSVTFAHLVVPPDRLEARLARRSGHFMPATLLRSQLDTLEPLAPDEPGAAFDGEAPPVDIAARIIGALVRDRPDQVI